MLNLFRRKKEEPKKQVELKSTYKRPTTRDRQFGNFEYYQDQTFAAMTPYYNGARTFYGVSGEGDLRKVREERDHLYLKMEPADLDKETRKKLFADLVMTVDAFGKWSKLIKARQDEEKAMLDKVTEDIKAYKNNDDKRKLFFDVWNNLPYIPTTKEEIAKGFQEYLKTYTYVLKEGKKPVNEYSDESISQCYCIDVSSLDTLCETIGLIISLSETARFFAKSFAGIYAGITEEELAQVEAEARAGK